MGEEKDFCHGPNQIIPAKAFKTSEPDGTILISPKEGEEKIESVYSFFKEVASKFPDHPAMLTNRDEHWEKWTYEEYFQQSYLVAKAMIKLGLGRFHGVCIMGYNSPEWFISNFGAVFAGGFSVGVYTTNSPEACYQIAQNCRAQIIVVENDSCLQKFLAFKEDLPHIKAIIQWRGKPTAHGVLSWSDLLNVGKMENDEELQKRLSQAAVNQCCALIYTSGTTGPPKGVMLSQNQLTWASKQYCDTVKLKEGEETILSYLPLSHLAAHMVDLYIAVKCAATVYFAPSDALKGSLGSALVQAQPTIFAAVPRVWEKIYEKMRDVASKSGYLKQYIGQWAKSACLRYYSALQEGREPSYIEKVWSSAACNLILYKVKTALGLNRAKCLVTAGAPIAPDVLRYFCSIDLPIMEFYGMSESLSFGAMNIIESRKFNFGSVGKVLPFISVKLRPVNGSLEQGVGEILMKGRNVCMGYLGMPDKTNEAIDDDGWLHTGDIGRIDSNGFLYITGRLKELVITSGGENIPPILIEDAVKKELPCISNAILIGDKRKYLTMLLTLKSEVNLNSGEPLPELTDACKQWLAQKECNVTSVPEAIEAVKNSEGPFASIIQEGINRYNEHHAISHAQRIQRWTFLPHDFSLATGELNNTLKMKRSFIHDKYANAIDDMYGGRVKH